MLLTRFQLYGLFILVSCVCLLTDGKAQTADAYKFESLDVNEGLSHGQVNSVLKDSRGFLWIGTAAGLNLYDGYTVKTFTYDPRDSSSINATDVIDLFEGPEGNIWVVTANGLTIYNPSIEQFIHELDTFQRKYSLPSMAVGDIISAPDSVFWFLTEEMGVIRYNASNGQSIQFDAHGSGGKIATDSVVALDVDSVGNAWLLHHNGVLQKIGASESAVSYTSKHFSSVVNRTGQNFEMLIDSDGDLWIYQPTIDGGVYHFQPATGTLNLYNTESEKITLNNDLVRDVVEETPGTIWVGTDHGGINIIHKESATVKYVLHKPELANSLSHNSVYCLYKDNSGFIWVGTYKNGVNYYHQDIKRFQHYKQLSSDRNSLPFDDVNRFVEDAQGNVWIGTNGGGLVYFDRAANTFKQYKQDPNDPKSISSNVIVSLMLDQSNALWVGTYFGGLNRYKQGSFRKYRFDPDDSGSISGQNVWELLQDSKGNIWVGTLSSGLDLMLEGSDEFLHYPLSDIGSDSTLHVDYILALEEDDEGNIWLAGGGGIDIIDGETLKVRQYNEQLNEPFLLGNSTIMSLHKGKGGRMWIGTQDGLHLFEKDKGLTRLFTMQDGLPHNTILTILEDDHNELWFSTPNGISNMQAEYYGDDSLSFSFINYDESDGLQGKVFNENAALKTSRGELIFGGPNGFNIFHPDDLAKNNKKPRIVFTEFELFNEHISVGEKLNGRVLFNKSLLQTEEIELAYDENVFAITFAALNFLHPGKNEYRYKLEGFDAQWREAESTRKATYTNLDPGNYTFKVIASNNDGVWNKEGKSLSIIVHPPFWKTTWAYTLYVILSIVILYIVRRVMLQRERTKFEIEQERREAKQMHELDLLKIRFFTNVSHEFRTPLSLILAPLERLIKQADSDQQKSQYQLINRNARRLLNLVNQLLDFRKLEVDTVGLNTSKGNIIKFIEESVHSFSDLSENKNVVLNFSSNVQAFYTAFDMDKMEKILFNLLSNAFKFTPEKGQIDVTLELNEGRQSGHKELVLKVADTGIGISEEQQKRVFDRFFKNDKPGKLVNQGSGIGLAITQEFVRIHGGTISVKSKEHEGTCFTIQLPLKEHEAPVSIPETEKALATSTISWETDEEEKAVANIGMPQILIVEDNEDFRFYLKDNLRIHFQVLDAKNGKEGWQKALANLPDLIVSDLMMPEVNGIEFCKKVKEDSRTSHIPFVLLTADAADDQKVKGLNTGADDYVTKPFNFEILMSRINNLIQQRHAMQETYKKKISVETSEIEITSLDDQLIQNAVKVVEEYISDPGFSVEILSRELGMSRVHLYKKMVSLTGKTPIEFIRQIRLQRAAQFLRKSQLTVAEVAYKVGFNNRKYFSKYFKMEYNMLPSAFAEKERKDL